MTALSASILRYIQRNNGQFTVLQAELGWNSERSHPTVPQTRLRPSNPRGKFRTHEIPSKLSNSRTTQVSHSSSQFLMNRLLCRLLAVAIVFLLSLPAGEAESKSSLKYLTRIERHLFEYTPRNANKIDIKIESQVKIVNGNLGESGLKSRKDSTPIEVFEFFGEKGDILKISVSSGKFDPVVWILAAEKRVLLAGNDDSENSLNAEFTTVLPSSGNYWLAVNSYGKEGSYELRIEKLPSFGIPEGSRNPNKRALLIGINDYFGAQNDLTAPTHDVDTIRDLLINTAEFDSENILVIKDRSATLDNIHYAINSFLGSVPEDGVAVLYYSGHGVQLTADNDSESDKKDEALYLGDSSYLLDDELYALVGCLNSQKVVVIVDACHSGGISRGAGQKNVVERNIRNYLDIAASERSDLKICPDKSKIRNKEFNLVISASQENELAWEWKKWESFLESRSVFTHYLVEDALDALKNNPGMSVKSFIREVSNKTNAFTQDKRGRTQEGRVVDHSNSRRIPTIGDIFGIKN